MAAKINKEAEHELLDLHSRLHVAMHKLIAEGDVAEAWRTLRRLDVRLTSFINSAKVQG